MSMEHKSFLFDFKSFNRELRPLLQSALMTGQVDPVREFVFINRLELTDPYEGLPLDENWEAMLEEKDVHQYGDLALTKYYSVVDDRGLGDDWEEIERVTDGLSPLGFSPVLGFYLGPDNMPFDPGKMGSYFQSEDDVNISLDVLSKVEGNVPDHTRVRLMEFKSLLEEAVNSGKGLYVTF